MLTFILGPSGSGKTMWLIEQANEEKRSGNGNIVFIDSEDTHIFSLDHSVRLINAKNFGIDDLGKLYGFIAGIISRDYDIEKIYLDGLYEIVDLKECLEPLTKMLLKLSEENNVEIFFGLDMAKEEMPEGLHYNVVELSEKDN